MGAGRRWRRARLVRPRVVLGAAGARAGWLAQAGAFGGALRHPGRAELSVAYVGVTPLRATDPPDGARWFPAGTLPPLAPRHRAIVPEAVTNRVFKIADGHMHIFEGGYAEFIQSAQGDARAR